MDDGCVEPLDRARAHLNPLTVAIQAAGPAVEACHPEARGYRGQGYLGPPTAGHPCLVRLLSADALSAAAVPRAGSSNAWSQEARGSANWPTGAGAAEAERRSRRGEARSAGASAYRNGCAP